MPSTETGSAGAGLAGVIAPEAEPAGTGAEVEGAPEGRPATAVSAGSAVVVAVVAMDSYGFRCARLRFQTGMLSMSS